MLNRTGRPCSVLLLSAIENENSSKQMEVGTPILTRGFFLLSVFEVASNLTLRYVIVGYCGDIRSGRDSGVALHDPP